MDIWYRFWLVSGSYNTRPELRFAGRANTFMGSGHRTHASKFPWNLLQNASKITSKCDPKCIKKSIVFLIAFLIHFASQKSSKMAPKMGRKSYGNSTVGSQIAVRVPEEPPMAPRRPPELTKWSPRPAKTLKITAWGSQTWASERPSPPNLSLGTFKNS